MNRIVDLSDRAPLRRVWLIASAWTLVALATAITLFVQQGLRFTWAVISAALNYSIMALVVWASCRFNMRLGLWSRPPLRALAAYLGLGVASIIVWCALELILMRLWVGPNFWLLVFASTWMFQLLSAVFIYAAAFGLGLVVQAFDREHKRREREARLEAAAHAAEIEVIKGQLRPHFLLNSLNSILALIDDEPAEARHMIGRLSSLLHAVFDGLDEPFVPLGRELGMVRDYLEVERIRFGDRLRFTIEADGATIDALVPPLLLQPLVENAVKHGIEPNAESGSLSVRARVEGERLRILVANTVAKANGHPGTGRGLELTRHRLQVVYGDESVGFNAGHDAAGFTASLDLPRVPNGG